MQTMLLAVAGTGAALAVGATVAERRRARRRDLDRVGLLPLQTIVFAGVLTAVLGLAFALQLS